MIAWVKLVSAEFLWIILLSFCSNCSSFGLQTLSGCLLCPTQYIPILFWALFYFLVPQNVPNSFYIFSVPAMEATTSPRIFGSFYCRSFISLSTYIDVNRIPVLQWIILFNLSSCRNDFRKLCSIALLHNDNYFFALTKYSAIMMEHY